MDEAKHRATDAAAGLEARLAAALDRLAPPGALGLAVSGGGDSVALLHLAHGWAQARGRTLAVATVDHGLRPEAAAEAAAVDRSAAALGLPHETLAAQLPAAGNRSAAAREARLALLADWAGRRGLAAIALAHTLDDQAETVLMRLARGSGVDGLAAMEEARGMLGRLWLRPLLGERRETLRAWLRARGIGWVEDPSNADPAYERVRVRAALPVLADLGIGAEALADTAARLGRQRAVLEGAAASLARRCLTLGPAGEIRLDPAPLAEAAEETALRLLARAIALLTDAPYPPRRAGLERLFAALTGPEGEGMALGGCLLVPLAGGGHALCREPARLPPPLPARAGAVWDARIAATASPGAPATIGALGAEDLAALKADPPPDLPPAWWRAPRAARLAAPALRDAEDRLIRVLAPGLPGTEPFRDLVADRFAVLLRIA
ncbi:MAG: tRNA lysidine(34) synthetase TilS [Pseudomonadota bacterium]